MSYSMFNRGKYWALPPTLVDGDISPVALDVNSNLKANVVASVLPTGAATEATLLLRTKPSDQQHAIIDSGLVELVDGSQNPVGTFANPIYSFDVTTGTVGQESGPFIVPIGGTKGSSYAPILMDSNGNVQVSGPLTDTQLRATPVPVSGTVTATGPLTDTQLRASAVPVSLAALPALTAGAALVGKVGIDQTTPGVTNLVNIGTDGAVVANAGANLNTSLLARETGGNLAASKADLDTLAATVSALRGSIKVFPGNPADVTVMQEILMELRAMRRLLMMVYEETGQGDPTKDLLKD